MATVFTFVRQLMEAPRPDRQGPLRGLAALPDGPALLAAALLLALGETARLEDAREMTFVRVAVAAADLRRLPPFAAVIRSRSGRCDVSLDPRGGGGPLGFLPRPVRGALRRRRAFRTAAF